MTSNDEVRTEWRGRPLYLVLAGTVFLLATGLVILLAPFGTGAQVTVVAHTLVGLVFLVPLVQYLWRHFARRWRDRLSHLLLLGWMAGLLMVAVCLSGIVLTVQAAWGRRIDYGWDLVHIVTGCAIGVILLVHLLTAMRRGEGLLVRRLLAGSTAVGMVLTGVVFVGGEVADAPSTRMSLPEGYSLRYGENPFAPSLARTDWLARLERDRVWIKFLQGLGTGPVDAEQVAGFLEDAERFHAADRACRSRGERHMDELGGYDADARRIEALREIAAGRGDATALLGEVEADLKRVEAEFERAGGLAPMALAGSQACGTAGCHEEILAEWEPSAHRYSSRSAFFQLVQGMMADSNGVESTRYCAGCHDPISLFSGSKHIFFDDLSSVGADEGISCAVCHSIVQTDVQGNANYVIAPPRRYLAEDSFLGRFLIRAYPRHHKVTYGRPLLQTPEFCGACHKQFIDEEINRATRVQLQNQYDAWKGSHWFVPDPENPELADEEKSLSCRDCHMRQMDSRDPAAEERKHRHHGYIASGQWLPLYHDLPHAEKHVRLTEEWLQGRTVIPEIADRWPGGPPVPIRLEVPETVRPGESVTLKVIADNQKVGHTFPTGPLDVIQAWVEVRVTQGDQEVFRAGNLDERGFIQPGSWIFKAEGVDRAGNLIDRHNLWDMVGARFRRVLFPGFSDQEEYSFVWNCESSPGIANRDVEFRAPAGEEDLEVEAVLRYRKVDQTLLNVLQPDGKLRAPVTDMSRATARIRVELAR